MKKEEVQKWIAIHKRQLLIAENDLKNANTTVAINKAKGDIRYLKRALKNAQDAL